MDRVRGYVSIMYSQLGIILFGLGSGTGIVEGQLPIGKHQVHKRWSAQFFLKCTKYSLYITAVVYIGNSLFASRFPSYDKN